MKTVTKKEVVSIELELPFFLIFDDNGPFNLPFLPYEFDVVALAYYSTFAGTLDPLESHVLPQSYRLGCF